MTSSNVRESVIEKHLSTRCKKHGFMCLKFVSPSFTGVPDRIVVSPAGTFFVELKRPGQRPRPRQDVVHDQLRRAGGRVVVIDSLEGVDALVEKLIQHHGP